jgi:heat shock protein 5
VSLPLIVIHSGKSESITITNEKGRLSKDEIDRMIREAEDFAAENETARKRIEALNSLSSFVYGLKTQIGEQEGLGGKISGEDRKALLALTKETTEWIDSEDDEQEPSVATTCFSDAHQVVMYNHQYLFILEIIHPALTILRESKSVLEI